MEPSETPPSGLPTEVILTQPRRSLGKIHLDDVVESGNCLELAGKTYLVLERRHRYQLRSGRYQLHNIALYVQPTQQSEERNLYEGRWVIGDVSCRFNARSELIRCAVNPEGPCDRCRYYEPIL
jgi:hypothetical protein